MSKTVHSVKLVAYNSVNLSALSYADGDVVYDNTLGTLRVMNGITPGGIPLLRADLNNQVGLTNVAVGVSQPSATVSGTLWFNSSNGGLYVYYSDTSGTHWVQANAPAFGSGASGSSTYILPAATNSALGGVTIPDVSTSGITNIGGTIGLATATTTQLGGVKVDGSTLAFNGSGQLYATGAGISYTLPTAGVGSGGILGGVKVDGTTITINNGVISGANTYTLPVASPSVLGGVKIDGTSITINTNGQLVASQAAYTLPTAGVGSGGTLGGVKVDGSTVTITNGVISATVASLSYGTRATIQTTTTSLAAGVSVTTSVSGMGKSYVLYSIGVSTGAWVVVYSNSSAQTADSSRAITTDPTPGSGVLAEAITTTTSTTSFTPAIFGYNNDTIPTATTYLKIYNNSGSSAAITVTLTYLRLE
jgi:hypothetical protein